MSTMNPVNAIEQPVSIFDQIKREIGAEYFQQKYANDGQRFVAWYVMHIHARDMVETREDVTDGTDDNQIDAIVVDDNNSTVYVVQGKFVGEKTVDAAPLREVLSSWVKLKDLVKTQQVGNPRLKRRLSEVATALEDEYGVSFELIITGTLTKEAQQDLARFQQELADSEDFPAELHLVDSEELKRRYDMALERENPSISHSFKLEAEKYVEMEIGGTKCVVAAVPLRECIRFPGIKDGTLFQKNVRQSLGLNNRVNKGIKSTIYGDRPEDFFFLHNGITAICQKFEVNEHDRTMKIKGLSVVNGCQSLNTILSCSEQIKELDATYAMIRFYEIPERNRGDRISISTNSQSAVKPRDLRSNDRRVLAMKRTYELKYPRGYFITKRGEVPPADRDDTQVVDLMELAKWMMAWHSQRPNISYSEDKLFDKHFEQLFKRNRDYPPENVYGLSQWVQEIGKRWKADNPLVLNESLLAMRSYAQHPHLYAVSLCICQANAKGDGVPIPYIAYEKARVANLVAQVVDIGGICLNTALEAAANETQPANRVFSPQNWIKSKACLAGIRAAVGQYFNMLPAMKGGKEQVQHLRESLKMEPTQFQERWAAD